VPVVRRVLLITDDETPSDLTVSAIRREVAVHPGWQLRLQNGAPSAAMMPVLKAWRPDGILTLIEALPAALAAMGPVVTLRGGSGEFQVAFDEEQIGATAAEALLNLGHRNLAVIKRSGVPDTGWRMLRNRGFVRRARAGGVVPATIAVRDSPDGDHLQTFVQGLQALPLRPCAVFTGNDTFAMYLLEACENLRLQVPDDLAILGADDLPAMEEQSVALSSVQLPHDALGVQGLRQLQVIWDGVRAPAILRLPPAGVSLRTSTEQMPSSDPAVVAALKFIQAHADRAIGLDEVAAAAGISRSTLAMRFRTALRRTVKEEIDRVRVARAIVLLTARKMSVTDVALAIGCSDSSHFTRLFRRVTGRRPFGYQQQET